MKKILFGVIAVLLILVGAGFAWYRVEYGGTAYYVKITENGTKTTEKDDQGQTFYLYDYDQKAFDKSGHSRQIEFTADHNLRHQAYLQLTYNQKKGVTNWEERSSKQVPEKALAQLNK